MFGMWLFDITFDLLNLHPEYTVRPGRCPGNDIGKPKKPLNLEGCKAACNNEETCIAFKYLISAQQCVLKSKSCDTPVYPTVEGLFVYDKIVAVPGM